MIETIKSLILDFQEKPVIHRHSPATSNSYGSRQGHGLYRRPARRQIHLFISAYAASARRRCSKRTSCT